MSVGRKVPLFVCLVMSKHIPVAIISVDLKPAPRRRKPAVDDCPHSKPAIAEPEGHGLLLASISGLAFDPKHHALTISPKRRLVFSRCEVGERNPRAMRPDVAHTGIANIA